MVDNTVFTDQLMDMVERGRQGMNQGFSMGLPRLEEIMDGVQANTYTVIAGGTGLKVANLINFYYLCVYENRHKIS